MSERMDEIIEDMKKLGQAYDPVKSPKGYVSHPSGIEPINITKHETFLRGNIIKYVMRAPYKHDGVDELQDLLKARQYLDWEIERAENAQLKRDATTLGVDVPPGREPVIG